MLDSMRKFGSSWVGKLIVALLLVGMAGFGISGVLQGLGSTRVASVGGEDISIQEFLRTYNNQLNGVASQIGSVPTPDQAVMLGIPGTAISRLASEKALTGLADRMGLGASDAQLGKLLREDPSFGGVLGQFDRANFQRALRQNGYTESEYLKTLKQAAQRQQIVLATFADINAPQAALEIVSRFQNDARTVEYFTLSPLAALPPAEPTEEELQAYLTENQGQFRTEPNRTANFVVLTPEALASGIEVSEADIQAEYERSKLSLVKIETRDVKQVVLTTDEQKAAFEAGLAQGKTMDELIAQFDLKATDLGTLTKATIADTTLADAAFSLEEGKFALVPGALGTRAVAVSNIVPGGDLSLEEARDQLLQKIRTSRSRTMYIEVLDQIEELRAAFRPLDEIAGRYNLPVVEASITAAGDELSAVGGIPQDGRSRVANAVFAQEMGDLAPSVSLGANISVWFDLVSIEDARDQTLADVGDEIRKIIIDQRVDEVLAAEAEQSVQQLSDGSPIQAVAASKALFAEISAPITRNGGGIFTRALAEEVFNGGPDHFGSARTDKGEYVVFQVTDVTAGTADQAEQVRPFLSQAVRDDMFSEFSSALRDDAGVTIYQQVLQQAIGLNAGQAGQ